jgi:hypothetical protein
MDFHSERRMPSGERPRPTKREMHTNYQPSALSCRAAAQFNTALEPTRITRYDLPMSRRLFNIFGPRGSA